MKRAAAISTGPYTHLDHLGVLAALLKIPLIVTDENCFHLAQKFYPQAEVQFKEPAELSLDFLAGNFDLLFGCGKYWCMELAPLFQLLYNKNMRFVFCPHGNSDKRDDPHPAQDIALIYGTHMQELMTYSVSATIRTGNYRYPFYRKHKAFYDALAERELFHKFAKEKPVLLYAPTWGGKIVDTCESLIANRSSTYNLLIKPHPFSEEEEIAELSSLHEQYREHPSVAFADGFPAIYPLLAKCDLYLGDYSSVGYDFLAFDKPLYFLHAPKKEIPFIAQAGVSIGLDLGKLPPQPDLSDIRRQVYKRAFGEERSPSAIKKEICAQQSNN